MAEPATGAYSGSSNPPIGTKGNPGGIPSTWDGRQWVPDKTGGNNTQTAFSVNGGPGGTMQSTGTLNSGTATVTPTVGQGNSQIGIVDLAGQAALDPSILMDKSTTLSQNVPKFTEADIKAGLIDKNSSTYKKLAELSIDPATIQASTVSGTVTAQAALAKALKEKKATLATTDPTYAEITAIENQMQAAQGTVDPNALIDPNAAQIDTEAIGRGETETGKALNTAAQQNMTNIIDTSTMAGKILAESLGEGNYTDAKATLKGQLDVLQAEFTGPNGEPKIPVWAAGTARGVSRIAAFKGMTGTAATAAMAQAIMEASIPIAQQDAAFFQTLTIKNLDNRQEQTINKANVLSKMDLTNADMRMTAAVENANKFMQMDMKNLDNEQQARLINTQSRVQSILEDAKAENTARMFNAQSQTEMDKFYSSLGAQIDQFNVAQTNSMRQFNASETNETNKFNVSEINKAKVFNASSINDARQFNADMENNREQFYKTMQFNVDTSNAKWRQTTTLQTNNQKFEAAATDVKNRLGIQVEMLNQLWDRSDSLLDYAWKTADNEQNRKHEIAITKLQGDINSKIKDKEETGDFFGTLLGWAGRTIVGAFGF